MRCPWEIDIHLSNPDNLDICIFIFTLNHISLSWLIFKRDWWMLKVISKWLFFLNYEPCGAGFFTITKTMFTSIHDAHCTRSCSTVFFIFEYLNIFWVKNKYNNGLNRNAFRLRPWFEPGMYLPIALIFNLSTFVNL